MHDAHDTGSLFGPTAVLPPLETRLTAFSLIGPLFRTLLCSLLSLFPSQLPCIAYLSHIQYSPLRLAWAKRRIADRSFPAIPLTCLPPQALHPLRFSSARSRIFGTRPWFYPPIFNLPYS